MKNGGGNRSGSSSAPRALLETVGQVGPWEQFFTGAFMVLGFATFCAAFFCGWVR